MATSMVKSRHPFDLLLNWDKYIDYINHEFSAPEESRTWEPQVDLKEKDGHYLIKMNLPGVNHKDIHIDFKNDFLIIEGKRKDLKSEANIHPPMNEINTGDFKKVFKFPQGINKKSISKSFKNGILEIKVPVSYNEKSKLKNLHNLD